MKRVLINSVNPTEWRVALTDDRVLYDLDIELLDQQKITANIYKARVSRIEPSLEAAFVDYGGNRHGFLSIKDIAPEYFPKGEVDRQLSIKDVLHEGQDLIVQVDKEERGNKGAALTTCISLAGSYLVLMPNNPRAGGISRRIEGEERDELRNTLAALKMEEGMGVIIRTAGMGKRPEELQWDLDALMETWREIKTASATEGKKPFLIHQESNAIIRAMRDYLRPEISEIVVDSEQVFNELKQYLARVRPTFVDKVKLHQQPPSLFSFYQIESQAETAFQREVRLPSGGAIVIDQTEALLAVDVNSSRATKGSDIEETALNTNLEAANEIARQLRLRDMGGLIIIDFIDMLAGQNRRAVEKNLQQALSKDRARVQVGTISRFGLLEMSRQRLQSSQRDAQQLLCSHCHGQGSIRGATALSASLLRLLEERATQDTTAQLQLQVPTEIATYLLNEKRQAIIDIENNHNISILVIANPHFEIPTYEIKTVTVHEYAMGTAKDMSHKMVKQPSLRLVEEQPRTAVKREEPAVKTRLPDKPAPQLRKRKKKAQPSILKRLMRAILGDSGEKGSGNQSKKTTNRRTGSTASRSNQRRTRSTTTRTASGTRSRSSTTRRGSGQSTATRNPRSVSAATKSRTARQTTATKEDTQKGGQKSSSPNRRRRSSSSGSSRSQKSTQTATRTVNREIKQPDHITAMSASAPLVSTPPPAVDKALERAAPSISETVPLSQPTVAENKVTTTAAATADKKTTSKRRPLPPPRPSSLEEGGQLKQVETVDDANKPKDS